MNTIISVKQIARDTLPILIDNLVFPGMIYHDAGNSMTAKQGDSVMVRRPVRLEAKEFVQENGITEQGLVEEAVEVQLDKLATVDAAITAWDAYDDATIRRVFIEPAAAALADKINRDGLALYKDTYQLAGTAGTAPSSLEDLANAAYALDLAKVPTDCRRAVWNPKATAKLKQIPALVNADACGDTTALRTGSIGQVFGVENYMSQAVVHHTPGTLVSKSVTLTVSAAAANGSLTIGASASIAAATLVPGDVLTIGTTTHTVTEGGTGEGTSIAVKIFPAYTGAAGATVTITGAHDANLVFHPHAFAFVTRPLSAPAGVESYVTTYNGLSLRVVRGYDIRYKKEMLSMDVLYGFKTVYPEMAVRYLG